MDKILQSLSNQNDVIVTNDGATILKSIALDNAAAKVLVSNTYLTKIFPKFKTTKSAMEPHLCVF